MDRGRPRKKVDASAPKRAGSKSSRSAERRAFEALPKGWKVPDAVHMLEQSEVAALQKQAAQQAARFEIMRKEDVDSLSKVSRDANIPLCHDPANLPVGTTRFGRARGILAPYISFSEDRTT